MILYRDYRASIFLGFIINCNCLYTDPLKQSYFLSTFLCQTDNENTNESNIFNNLHVITQFNRSIWFHKSSLKCCLRLNNHISAEICPLASEASSDVANLTWRKIHTPLFMVSKNLSVCKEFWPKLSQDWWYVHIL